MTMSYRSLLLLLPALLALPPEGRSQAAEAETAGPAAIALTLEEAVGIALGPAGDARARIAEERVGQARARSDQSRAALLPHIEASVGQQSVTRNLAAFGINVRLPIPGYDFPTYAGPFDVFDARASAALSVLDLGAIRRYQASRKGILGAEQERESARDRIRETVARAYLGLLKARAGLEAARSNVDLAERLLGLAESRKAAGAGIGIEITRARVQLANERQHLLAAVNGENRAQLELVRTLGLDLGLRVEPSGAMAYVPEAVHDFREALQTALERRTDWKAQLEREEAARLEQSADRMERLPSVRLFAEYGTIGSGIDDAVPTRTYGFSVQVPVFDGGRTDGRRAESASRLRQLEAETRDLRAQIELDIRLALDSLESADLQVAAAGEGLLLAEQELAQAERRFEAGVGSSIEATGAQTRLERARANRIDALFAHGMARIDLYSALGTIAQMISGGTNP